MTGDPTNRVSFLFCFIVVVVVVLNQFARVYKRGQYDSTGIKIHVYMATLHWVYY